MIDVHAHFVTDAYVAAARAAGHEQPDGMPGWPSWTLAGQLELMEECGIERSVLSISSPGTHFGDDGAARALSREVNEVGAGFRRDHPDRFGHLASLPLPDVDGALAEAAYALDELGSDGVTVETNAHGRYLGDASLAPLWSELSRRETVVFVHPTSPVGAAALTAGRPRPMLEFVFETARTFADLVLSGTLARFPGMRWIATHGGGALPLVAERLELFRSGFLGGDGEPVPDQLRALWFDTAGTPFPHQVPLLDRVVGLDHLVYGSDSCWTPPAVVTAQVASIDAADPPPGGGTWRELTTANAGRLFA
ncbi:amidohydrolase family protein [Actinomycetospora termitidis]|uniref:6-methylsalicylate decarboxylase n=1 Tax=Actinomycetospora termitidis TaxID=3053470 RepID=A0ABT7MEM5_9PSEU|nr:amidohydrolase family protein [Actinomycetospora sp. Odt1-22]MDL5158342.1 amidohydrolase family protein [Actinomycetospora sp. Odt1-22]